MIIGLVGCSNQKEAFQGEARKVYSSTLFRMSMELSEKWCDATYILSAKYKVIAPDEIIKPYNESLKDYTKKGREKWSVEVINQLVNKVGVKDGDTLFFFCGKYYYESMLSWDKLWKAYGWRCEMPFQGLRIGERLKYIKERLHE